MTHPKSVTVRFIRLNKEGQRIPRCLTIEYDSTFSMDCNVTFARCMAFEECYVDSIIEVILNY